MSRSTDYVLHDLNSALNRIPKDGLILTKADVARLVDAVGGWVALEKILNPVEDSDGDES